MLDNISQEIAGTLLQAMGETGICFYPGGFKPPHKGHFAAAEWLSKKPQFTSVEILIGKAIRGGITAYKSQEIWDKYISVNQPSKLQTKICVSDSPIKDIIRYVKNNNGQKVYLALGESEDSRRYESLKEYNIEIVKIPSQFNRISGTEARQSLLSNDKEKFIQTVPDFIQNKEEIFISLTLNELSDKTKKMAIEKFQKEKPDLGINVISHYVNRFEQLQNSPHIKEKDIFKYNWKELERAIDSAPVKSTGKKDTPPTTDNADLIYNENGLRIYKGHTKKACIKYGTGYSWCISARGEGNMYGSYRFGEGGTPYFVFDDTKSHEQKEDGNFVDPNHALVVFRFDGEGSSDGMDYPTLRWSVTNADNNGDKEFDSFSGSYTYGGKAIIDDFPRLKGLEDLFDEGSIDPQEKKEWEIESKYDDDLYHLNRLKSKGYYTFGFISIAGINIKLIDKLLSGEIKATKVDLIAIPKVQDVDYERISKVICHHDKYELEQNVEEWIKEVTSPPSHVKPDGIEVEYNSIFIKDPIIDSYLNRIKEIYFKYKNELNKAQINESVINEVDKNKAIIDDFVDFVCELIEIKNKPKIEILDKPMVNGEQPSFGAYNPNNNSIMVCFGKRHILDALRTLAHELTHYKQDENGDIKDGDGNTGSQIENEANTTAGIIMREYGKIHPELF